MGKINYQPAGYHSLTPYVTVEDAPGFIEFISKAFGAVEKERMLRSDGKIMHTVAEIGDSKIMISESCGEEMPAKSVALYLYVEDTDKVYQKALEAGATSAMAPCDMFWGDRFSSVKDRWNNDWSISTHTEDVTADELEKRAKDFARQMDQGQV